MAIEIVKAVITDIPEILNLEKACFAQDAWTFLDLAGLFCHHRSIRLKALVDDEFAGFAAAEESKLERVAWITTVGVFAAFRKKGIGTALVNACEQAVRQPCMRLAVSIENADAIRLYRSLGYHQIDSWKNYYAGGRDALVMEKLL